MNGFFACKNNPLSGTFAYDDVDKDDRLLRDGGPPWDEIIRAYHDFTRNRKLWPRPRIENTRWKSEEFEGKEMTIDGETDRLDYGVTTVELRDFNNEVLAVYEFDNRKNCLHLKEINEHNPNLRESLLGQHRPGERYKAARTKRRIKFSRGLLPHPGPQ